MVMPRDGFLYSSIKSQISLSCVQEEHLTQLHILTGSSKYSDSQPLINRSLREKSLNFELPMGCGQMSWPKLLITQKLILVYFVSNLILLDLKRKFFEATGTNAFKRGKK